MYENTGHIFIYPSIFFLEVVFRAFATFDCKCVKVGLTSYQNNGISSSAGNFNYISVMANEIDVMFLIPGVSR